MAKEKDLTFSEGETWILSFALRDAAGQPLDLTGALVEWAVESTVSGGASLLVDSDGAFVVITDAVAGLGTVSIPPADHASVPAGEYRHELRATLADATVTVQITGNLTVGASVFGAGTFGVIRTGGLQLEFDTAITDADPGDGEFRFNHATPSSAAFVYIDLLDRFGVDITDWLAALDDSTTTAARGHLRFTKAGNEGVWHEYLITGAVVTATGYRKVPVSYIDGGGSFAAGDIVTVSFSRTGNTGSTGPTGPTGPAGADGGDAGILYDFATETADADPGAGTMRANNANLSAATELYIDDVDRSANNHEAALLTWDDSTNTVNGHLLVSRPSDGAQTIFAVGAVTDATGYVKVAVTYVSGATSFSAADVLSLQFSRAGDVGATGVSGTSALTVVRVVATGNVAIATALEAGDAVDGVTLAENDLVLLTGQTAPAENGVYVVPASGAASRHASFDAYDELPGSYFSVMEGTAKADTLWRCTSDRGGTIGTTAVAISEFTGGGATAPTRTTATLSGTSTDVAIPAGCTHFMFQSKTITLTATGNGFFASLRHTSNTVEQAWSGFESDNSIVSSASAFAYTLPSGTSRLLSGYAYGPRDSSKPTIAGGAGRGSAYRERHLYSDSANDHDTLRFVCSGGGTFSGTVEIMWFYN